MENRGVRASTHPQPSHEVAGVRLEWIDVARGIGIIAVVAGHVWTRGALRDAVYSFHMPLFFLLSGMLSRSQPPRPFALRLLASQTRPYVAFLALLIIADQLIEPLRGHRPIFHQWPQDLLPVLLGGSWLRGPYTIFWFVPCLLVSRILFNALLARWPNPLDRRWAWVLPPVMVVAYGIGHVTQKSVLGLLTVPMAFLLLWVGAVWHHVPWRRWMWVPLGAFSLTGLAGLLPTLNMKAADYGLPLLSIVSAIATSLLVFQLSLRIAPYGRWLAAIGRASLVIMYLHVALIHYLSPVLGKPWLLICAMMIPTAVYYVLLNSPTGRRIFL